MEVARFARAWVEGYTEGWRTFDAERIAALYAEDAVYRSHPFREPEDVLEYTRRNFEAESELEFAFGEPVAAGDRAAVEYWAALSEDGEELTLAGVTLLRFREDGLVVEHRDYWALQPGRRPPFEGWSS